VKTLKLTFAGLFLAAAISPASEVPSAEHVKWMKDLGAQMGAIRKGVDVKKNADDMQATLKLVGAYWKTRNSPEATKACGMSFKGAAAVAAAGDDKEKMMAGMKMIGGGCKGCHDPHREKISDTEYKIK
jgi:cytochrome c556